MKNVNLNFYLLFFIWLCLPIGSAHSQVTFPKWQEAVLKLEDGSDKQGEIKMRGADSKKIKFREGKGSNTITYKKGKIKAIVKKHGNGYIYSERIHAKGFKKGIFMTKVLEGNVNMYAFSSTDNYAGWMDHYYLKRENEELATKLSGIGFKEPIMKYLSDCEKVVKQIKETPAMQTDFFELVKNYNSCN